MAAPPRFPLAPQGSFAAWAVCHSLSFKAREHESQSESNRELLVGRHQPEEGGEPWQTSHCRPSSQLAGGQGCAWAVRRPLRRATSRRPHCFLRPHHLLYRSGDSWYSRRSQEFPFPGASSRSQPGHVCGSRSRCTRRSRTDDRYCTDFRRRRGSSGRDAGRSTMPATRRWWSDTRRNSLRIRRGGSAAQNGRQSRLSADVWGLQLWSVPCRPF